MVKVYSSAVVIIPPHELWFPIQEIRKNYDRQINRWMPHITLLYPFKPEDHFILISESFVNICQNINSFRVSLNDFNYFHHKKNNYTIWLSPKPTELIIKLQESLLSIVPECNDVNSYKSGFIPHLSLGQTVGRLQTLSILNDLRKKWMELTFLLDKVYFIARKIEKNSAFEIKKVLYLGNVTK